MKTIGLLGGMSWESTLTYYRVINETVQSGLGGLHSAQILLCSVDFAPIERWQAEGQWDQIAAVLSDAAGRLETAGADFLVLCSNTAHRVAPEIRAAVSVPLLHIAEVTAEQLKAAGITTAGLLGTRYTMTQPFYTDVLEQAGIQVLLPEGEEIGTVDAVIFDELCAGTVREESGRTLRAIAEKLRRRGAQGVVLGCTELGLLIRPDDMDVPVFDTALLHAQAAARLAMERQPETGGII